VRPLEVAAPGAAPERPSQPAIPLARDPHRSQRLTPPAAGDWHRSMAVLTLRLLARIARNAAARHGSRLLLTPLRRTPSRDECGLLATARREWIPFAGLQIPVWLWEGASYRPPTVLLVHDWGGCAADLAAFVGPLRREGARVVAFDAPAHGAASGDCTDLGEIAAIVAMLLRRHAEWAPPRGIVAHGFGTLASTLAAATGAPVERFVFLAAAESHEPYLDSFRLETRLDEALLERVRLQVEARLGQTLESIRGARLVRNLERPLLAFHDADDAEIDIEHSRRLVDRWTGAQLVRTYGLGHRGLLHRDAVIAAAVEHLLVVP